MHQLQEEVRDLAEKVHAGGYSHKPGHGPMGDVLKGLKGWGKLALKAAEATMKTYGAPDDVGSGMLVWYEKKPFSHIIIHKRETPHLWPAPHQDTLEQAVSYRVPLDRYSEIVQFDGAVWAERTRGLLIARCHIEAQNFLALNLAKQVADGMSAKEARKKYEAETKLNMAKKPSKISQGLLFTPQAANKARDPDKTTIKV